MADTTLSAPKSHLVAFAYEAWGHVRPLIVLCARIAKAGPVLTTVLTPLSLYERTKTELARNFAPGEQAYLSRVRIVAVQRGQHNDVMIIPASFVSAWRDLVDGKAITCAHTGQPIPAILPPKAALIDCFAYESVRQIRDVSGDSAKIYGWIPSALSTLFYYMFGPESLGGGVSMHDKAEAEARRTGRAYEDVAGELLMRGRGEVVRVPGLPPMYDYEYHPQHFPIFDGLNTSYLARTYDTMLLFDGAVVATPECYEREAVAAARTFFADIHKPVYVLGPLQASGAQAAQLERAHAPQAQEVEAFLDKTLKESGERSLLYISFGSIFWPMKAPEQLWAFLDAAMELGIPFLLSHASPFAVIPDSVREKVHEYGKALVAPWVPQQLVLNHPVTGWFVTHGGHNSVLEALSAGVPQIFWPFEADQPLNAVRLTEHFSAAYELLEVRTGLGLKPLCRNGKAPAGTLDAVRAEARDVLVRAFGEEGKGKRANALQLRDAVRAEWEEPVGEGEGGASWRDFRAFVATLWAEE
ncbi:glycosyltransferase family 1 protein [Trametes coccinea BRFM310]|uniref:Glycosyltransferase family 1 protein n=1 Tax=Trametes coccinea (strain BRFM310) TaxID=1353009 RepID=A0A1Y2IRX8_TRAC3|nr:glycosyltransferase family 1 protein [Trametes coccinea BRFM310]